jgi:hypothetical protein
MIDFSNVSVCVLAYTVHFVFCDGSEGEKEVFINICHRTYVLLCVFVGGVMMIKRERELLVGNNYRRN